MNEGDRVLIRNMTPRGGTGKLRNHWEDCIHKVIRQVGKDMPIYEVIPEQGKARGRRILHCNLLLPCDHLPLEIQLKPAKVKRQITAQTRRDRDQADQESNNDDSDDDDYGYYPLRHQPVPQPQVHTEREDAEGVTQLMQDVEPKRRDMHQLGRDTGDPLLEEDMSIQEETALEERIPRPQSSAQSEDPSENEPQYQRPARERRPPRVFTYDQLGHPSCCGAGLPSNMMCYYPPTSYGAMQAASSWTAPGQHWNYRPAVAHGY